MPPYMTLPGARRCADAGVSANGVLRAPRLFPPRAALTEVERLIYRPSGEACPDFLNLKSQSPPPLLALSYSPLNGCQLRFTAPPPVCADMRAAILPCTWIPKGLECLSCPHASTVGRTIFASLKACTFVRLCVDGRGVCVGGGCQVSKLASIFYWR